MNLPTHHLRALAPTAAAAPPSMNIHSLHIRGTMASYYSVDDVLAYVEIPLPEEDDISEDEFEGYIDQEEEEEEEDDKGEGSGDESEEELDEDELDDACDSDNIPKFVGQGAHRI